MTIAINDKDVTVTGSQGIGGCSTHGSNCKKAVAASIAKTVHEAVALSSRS